MEDLKKMAEKKLKDAVKDWYGPGRFMASRKERARKPKARQPVYAMKKKGKNWVADYETDRNIDFNTDILEDLIKIFGDKPIDSAWTEGTGRSGRMARVLDQVRKTPQGRKALGMSKKNKGGSVKGRPRGIGKALRGGGSVTRS